MFKLKQFSSTCLSSIFSLQGILFLIAFLVYANMWANDFPYYNPILTSHLTATGLDGSLSFTQVFLAKATLFGYSPISTLAYALEYKLVGDYPPFSHITNLLLHAVTVTLLFGLIKRMLPATSSTAAFLICLLFAVHPVHTAVVDSLDGRSELLGLLFLVLSFRSMYTWLATSTIGQLLKMLAFAFLGLLAQPVLAFWFLLPIYSFVLVDRKDWRQLIKVAFAFGFIVVLYGAYRLGNITPEEVSMVDNPLVVVDDNSQRVATAILASSVYFKLLVFPITLCSCYGIGSFPIVGFEEPLVYLTILLYTLLLLLALFNFHRSPLIRVGAFIVLLGLLPSTNVFFLQPEIANEKVMYGASFGIAMMFVGLIERVFSYRPSDSLIEDYKSFPWLKWLISLTAIPMIFLTVHRNFDWLNGYILSRADVEESCGKSAKMQYLAGYHLRNEYVVYGVRDREDGILRAKRHFLAAASQFSEWTEPHLQLSQLYANEGKEPSLALYHANRAKEIDPHSIEAQLLVAAAYEKLDSAGKAIEEYANVLKMDQANKEALNKIVSLYFLEGEMEAAEMINKRFFQLHPDVAEPLIHQGNLALSKKDSATALNYFKEAYSIDTTDMEFNNYLRYLEEKLNSSTNQTPINGNK